MCIRQKVVLHSSESSSKLVVNSSIVDSAKGQWLNKYKLGVFEKLSLPFAQNKKQI